MLDNFSSILTAYLLDNAPGNPSHTQWITIIFTHNFIAIFISHFFFYRAYHALLSSTRVLLSGSAGVLHDCCSTPCSTLGHNPHRTHMLTMAAMCNTLLLCLNMYPTKNQAHFYTCKETIQCSCHSVNLQLQFQVTVVRTELRML
jgi:hypothetical protein